MNLTPAGIFDVIAAIAFGAALGQALRLPAKKTSWEAKALFCLGLMMFMIVCVVNFLENSGISTGFAGYEDFSKILFLLLLMFFLYALGTRREINRRAESEKQLLASRQEYQSILNNIGIAVALLDSNMRIVSINRQMESSFPKIDFKTKPLCHNRFDPPHPTPCPNCPVEKTLKDGLVHEAIIVKKKDFENISYRIIASPLIDRTGKTVGVIELVEDVTEKLKSETHVRMLQSAVEQSSEGLAVLDQDGTIVFANDALAKMHGYEPAEVIGKSVSIFHTRDQMEYEVLPFTQQVTQIGSARAEIHHMRRGGAVFPTLMSSVIFKDQEGNVAGRVTTVTDITEHKQATEALRKSDDKFRALAETSLDWLWEYDENYIFRYVSPRIQNILGYQSGEVVGKSLFDFVAPDEVGRLKNILQTNPPKPINQLEAKYLAKEGKIVVLDTSGVPFFDASGRFRGYRGISRDITIRKQAEEGLQSALEKARELEEIVNRGFAIAWLWKAEKNWPVEFVSDNISQFGYTVEEFTSGQVSFSDLIYEKDRARVIMEVNQHIEAHEEDFLQTYRIKTKSGAIRWVEDHTWFRQDPSGEVTHFQGMTIDITKRKQAEATRRKLETQMQRMQKLESLSILAGGVAHDFNNLLMIITGNADLGLMDAPQDSTQAEILQEIKDAAVRASKLSNQMRAYSGQGHVGMEQVVLNDIVTEMLRLLKSSIPKKIQLECDFSNNLPFIEADTSQINQVVMNLVINASEAIGDNEGTISIRTDTFEATSEYLAKTHLDENLPTGPYVLLEVSDTGCGMNAETQEKIFDPFFTTKFIGRGLGLAAVFGIIRGHRGAIRVISEPSQGCTFQVLFPLGKETAKLQASPANTNVREWKGHGTVLVVDDEKSFLNVASIILKRSGFEVATAEDGRQAVDYFNRYHDQVVAVLLDMSMPVMGGEETFAELRKIDDSVPVFLCSGFSEQDAARHFSGGGLAGFLQKPFQIDTLLSVLRKVMEP